MLDFDALVGPSSGSEGGVIVEAGDAEGSGPAGDASAEPDSPLDRDAAPDGDTHVGPNLVPDGTFDSVCPLGTFQGTVASDGTARRGAKSCRVCTLPATPDYFTAGSFASSGPAVGSTYHAEIWVRTAPGAATPPGILLHLRTSNDAPFVQIQKSMTSPRTIDATWQKIEITLQPTIAAARMDLFFGSDTAVGACFLVDDVWLERLP